MKNAYLIKIVPPFGYRVFRLEFTRRHVAFAVTLAFLTAGAIGGYYVRTLRHAEASVGALRTLTSDQRDRLQKIDAQATELDDRVRALQQQNERIRKMIDARPTHADAGASELPIALARPHVLSSSDAFADAAARIERLRADSSRVRSEGDRLQSLAMRVLNMHRLEDLARARVLAAIPSVNPAGPGVGIRSAYGWRVDPWPEFHRGVDLDVDYGDPVRAAAAGTVVAAGYDGGYGYKIDVDHGNGYHTWYCHLSRIDVSAGQYVTKAQHIALVGSTGASTGPHLHYQIMLDGQAVDPTPYLAGVPAPVLASLH
ncbi:MAG: M23 family metallopeptidase [Candidatus Eremiobacteraeota bacterium]|nr:M23 family metallopeptidase [Candidatus Eremiobacteraeota bacterium]